MFKRFLILGAFVLLAASCTENKQTKDESRDVQTLPRNLSPSGGPTGQPKASAIPTDAQFTIYCQGFDGPNHVELANNMKAQLLKATPMKDWYVIHEDAHSVLYYGFYRAIDDSDPKDAQRARNDVRDIQGVSGTDGERLFAHCYLVEVTTPDPQAPTEWNLTNANGYWSLQIAAYKDSPKRKEYAVDAVREARKQGIPAYFYHGPTASSVCVGAWPRSAVKEQDESNARASDPDQTVMVFSQPLPSGFPTDLKDEDGNRVRALAPRMEPLDPSLIEAMQKYPTHAINGDLHVSKIKDPLTQQIEEQPDPSFLVLIPHEKKQSLLDAPPFFDRAPAQTPAAPAPAQPLPGAGKLRTLQDQ